MTTSNGLLQEAAKRYKNVQVLTAFMPEAFGTHHSKMFILFRHDSQAQYVPLPQLDTVTADLNPGS